MDGVTTVTDRGVPPDVTWWGTSDGYAHAFRAGERTSVCRAWWAGLMSDAAGYAKCRDCDLLLTGAPGEITEAFGR